MQKKRVAIVINFLTDYRLDFYMRLIRREDLDVTIYCHLPPSWSRLKSVHNQFPGNVTIVEGYFFGREEFVFSNLPWAVISTRYDAVFVEGNPRYLSFAALASYLHFRRKHVVLWTMVHSFRNSKARQSLRLLWTKLFRTILVYSDAEVEFLKDRGFTANRVIAINNGLNQDAIDLETARWSNDRLAKWQQSKSITGRRVILSCARLDEKNKFQQILEILPTLCRKYPEIIWCVIGDGVLKERLQRIAEDYGLSAHVRLLGAIHDECALAPWFLTADLLVHPGAIGLTLLHAFGYGLPVITHSNSRTHGPEFAAFVDQVTGMTYEEDDRNGLATALEDALSNPILCASMSQEARLIAQMQYNTQVMENRFCACIE